MTETLPLAEARNRLSELATLVETTHERITVTRNGRPSFMLISPDDLESLEETLDIMSDPEAMEDIQESMREYAAGQSISMTKEEMLAWLSQERERKRCAS